MIFRGISRGFSLLGEEQYETIGAFWDDMEARFGLENLRGLGYLWQGGKIYYAIGLKSGDIDGYDFEISLPDHGWVTVTGKAEDLKAIYDEIYESGSLKYEIEEFYTDGRCEIQYIR